METTDSGASVKSHEEIIGEERVVHDAADAVVKPAPLQLGVRLRVEEQGVSTPEKQKTNYTKHDQEIRTKNRT